MSCIPITFSSDNRNFGLQRWQLMELAQKKAICLPFPKSCLTDRAVCFSQFKSDPISQAFFRTLHFLVSTAVEQDNIYRSLKPDVVGPQLVFLLEQFQEPDPSEKPVKKKGEDTDSSSGEEDKSEVKRTRERIPKIVGYRVHMYWDKLDDNAELGDYLESYLKMQDQFRLNDMATHAREAASAALGEKPSSKPSPGVGGSLGRISIGTGGARLPPRMYQTSHWIQALNHLFAGRGDFSRPAAVYSRQSIVGSDADPENALTFERMFAHTAQMRGVHPVQLNIQNYVTQVDGPSGPVRGYIIPMPHRTFRYNQDQLRQFWFLQIPDALERMDRQITMMDETDGMYSQSIDFMKQLAVVKENENGVHEFDYKEYKRYWESEGVKDNDGIKYPVNKIGIGEYFKTSLGTMALMPPDRYDPDFYARASIRDRKRVLHVYNVRRRAAHSAGQEWSIDRQQQEKACMLDEWRDRMAESLARLLEPEFPFLSPYTKPVLQYAQQYRDAHQGSLCRRFNKRSSNLSLWEDFLTTMVREMELLDDVSTSHFEAVVCMFAAYNMSDPIRNNKIIVVNQGPARTSKSFVTDLVESMCIKETILTLSYQTMRAETSGGNFDGVMMVFNEAPENMMGCNRDKCHGRDAAALAANVNVEATNTLKERTTRGKIVVHTMVIDKITGERTERIFESYRNASYIFNTNANVYRWDPATLSRMVIQHFSQVIREGSRPNDKNFRRTPEQIKEERDKLREKYKWIQMHIRFIDEAIEKKQLCAVNTEFSRTMLRYILRRAEELGVPETDCPRKMATIMAAVRIGIKIRAILLAFGCQLNRTNPDGLRAYDFLDTILMDGFLVDTDPSILVSIMGIFKFIYEDPLRFDVIRALTLKYLLSEEKPSAISPDQKELSADDNAEEERALIGAADAAEIADREKKLSVLIENLRRLEMGENLPIQSPKSAISKQSSKKSKSNRSNTDDDELHAVAEAMEDPLDEEEEDDMEGLFEDEDDNRPIPPPSKPPVSALRKSAPAGGVGGRPPQPPSVRFSTEVDIRELKKQIETGQKDLDKLKRESDRRRRRETEERRHMASSYRPEDWIDDDTFWTPARLARLQDPNRRWPANKNFVHLRLPFCRPSAKTGYYYRPITIYGMAKDICTIIPSRPSMEHVEECLTQLANLPLRIAHEDRETGGLRVEFVKAIQFEEPMVAIHKDLLRYNSRSRLEQAVREVVSDFIGQDQDFTFGRNTESPHYDEFRVIRISSKASSRPPSDPFILENQLHVSSVQREFNRVNLDGAFNELERMESEHYEWSTLVALQREKMKLEHLRKQQKAQPQRTESLSSQNNPQQRSEDERSEAENRQMEESELQERIQRAEAEQYERNCRDMAYPSQFHVDSNFAYGVWLQHMDDQGWSSSMIARYGAYPESITHGKLVNLYQQRRELAESLNQIPLAPLRKYPDYVGFEDYGEVARRDSAAIRTYSEKHGGQANPEFSLRKRLEPIAAKFGWAGETFDALEQGRLTPQDYEQNRRLARRSMKAKMRELEKQRKTDEQAQRAFLEREGVDMVVMEQQQQVSGDRGDDIVGSVVPGQPAAPHDLDEEEEEVFSNAGGKSPAPAIGSVGHLTEEDEPDESKRNDPNRTDDEVVSHQSSPPLRPVARALELLPIHHNEPKNGKRKPYRGTLFPKKGDSSKRQRGE